jgi:hypothetical protein
MTMRSYSAHEEIGRKSAARSAFLDRLENLAILVLHCLEEARTLGAEELESGLDSAFMTILQPGQSQFEEFRNRFQLSISLHETCARAASKARAAHKALPLRAA